ncbi:MAG TPA: hypothetical protein VGD84_00645 [Pseudonocardiaceae bacterium]
MGRSSSEDGPVEWWASDEDPHGGRGFWVIVLVFALPAIALLFAGAGGTALGAAFMLLFLLAGVVIGTIDWGRGRRAAVSITVDGPDDFVVRQVDGRVARYPFAAVSRVRATRDDGDETLSMRISVGDRVVRTRSGSAGAAATFLAMCAEAGAAVTYRTAVSD